MKRLSLFALLAALLPALALANGWDEQKYRQIEQSIQAPQFANRDYPITKYGAKPTNTAAKNQKAIQKAIEACSKRGGGRVVVPAGQHFLTGAITLLSDVNLVVEKDAVLEFAFQPELYPIVPTRWEGLDCWNLSPLIYAYKQKNIGITGEGTIDGGGTTETWWPWCGNARFGMKEGATVHQWNGSRARLLRSAEEGVPMDERRFGPEDGLRPQLINLNQCENILLENLTLLRSPFWVIHPLLSKNITVRGMKITNDGPNGDGCDPESCDGVLIENCFFNTGDDCIAIKSGRNNDGRLWDRPSENIIIRNCEMKNGHGGVVIGSEISGGCRNVYAHDNVMDSPNLDRVVRIKTNPCRGGIIENINARNIKVGQCGESVLKINLDYEPKEICSRDFPPTVRNVNIENITCEKSKYGVLIIALDDQCNVYDINVSNCRFNGVAEGNKITGQTRDVRYDNLYINGQLTLSEPPYQHYSEWLTYSEMQRVPRSYLLDFSSKPKWSYVMGIELEAMLDTYLAYGGDAIRRYCQEYTDTMIAPTGDIRGYNLLDYNLDNIRTGHFVTRMYQQWPEAKNLLAMQTMMRQLQTQPRTVADKVFWHKAIYAYQVWLDGIFMGLPYRTLTAPITEQAKGAKAKKAVTAIYDDAVNQLKTTYERTLDPATGLNRHAYDETRKTFWADPQTGLSQHCWGRAQGWYTMALIEVLDALPEDYARRQELTDLLVKDFDAILRWQDPASGVWYQVMDAPQGEGNYLESTCSSMFAYALLKAYRKGYVGEKYRDAGIRAYKGIVEHFVRINPDKTISLTQCCAVAGLGPAATPQVLAAMKKVNPKGTVKENTKRDGSFAYYLSEPIRDNDAKGVGPFIWASLEMEQLGYTTTNLFAYIDRPAVLRRHNPVITEADPLASLTVGNGRFATTVDITGLQSFPFEYGAGVPLTAMSEWGWHSFENTDSLTPSETQRAFDLGHGHSEVYAVEYKKAEDGRHRQATAYFRVNPHRLNLGTLGLSLRNTAGEAIPLDGLTDVYQELDLWNGIVSSRFRADGQPVEALTACQPDRDALLYSISSPLLVDGRAAITLRFSFPTGQHADDANDWTQPHRHRSRLVASTPHSATIERTLEGPPSPSVATEGGRDAHALGTHGSCDSTRTPSDSTRYYVTLQWEGDALLTEQAPHVFALTPLASPFALRVEYTPDADRRGADASITAIRRGEDTPSTEGSDADERLSALFQRTRAHWQQWWQQGAFVDFSHCTDPRALELERRVVHSQYLTQVNCGGTMPPQETGLTYNSWFGRPHLEMAWWHLVDFALWGRTATLAANLDWYNTTAYPTALAIAQRQGFRGARWMKMTDPWAGEAPSNTGSFLIWQQPHYIYMAEELFRAQPTEETLAKYGEQVEQTARFMADFVTSSPYALHGATAMQGGSTAKQGSYALHGATAMQESMSKDFSYNHPFELAYWQYGLSVAQRWRERRGLSREPAWDAIISGLPPLPEHDGIYTAGLPRGNTTSLEAFDPFDTTGGNAAHPASVTAVPTHPASVTAHPAVTTETFAEKSRRDHPAVLGACGLLPSPPCGDFIAAPRPSTVAPRIAAPRPSTVSPAPLYTKATMEKTLEWVLRHWNWQTTWGWDYGMTAMTAARLGRPDLALDALLIATQKNTYLPQGHNFQTTDRLRVYLPGNGALLIAVAMMCAGWDGCPAVRNPGFPADGTWDVRWEGLHRMQ